MLTIMEIVVKNSVGPETTTLGITHAIRMEIKYAYLVGEEIAAMQVLNFQLYGCMPCSINIFIASTLCGQCLPLSCWVRRRKGCFLCGRRPEAYFPFAHGLCHATIGNQAFSHDRCNLVFTKSVNSNFRTFSLAPVTRILGYSLFCDRSQHGVYFQDISEDEICAINEAVVETNAKKVTDFGLSVPLVGRQLFSC